MQLYRVIKLYKVIYPQSDGMLSDFQGFEIHRWRQLFDDQIPCFTVANERVSSTWCHWSIFNPQGENEFWNRAWGCRPSTWMTLGAARQWQLASAFHCPLEAFHTCHFLNKLLRRKIIPKRIPKETCCAQIFCLMIGSSSDWIWVAKHSMQTPLSFLRTWFCQQKMVPTVPTHQSATTIFSPHILRLFGFFLMNIPKISSCQVSGIHSPDASSLGLPHRRCSCSPCAPSRPPATCAPRGGSGSTCHRWSSRDSLHWHLKLGEIEGKHGENHGKMRRIEKIRWQDDWER